VGRLSHQRQFQHNWIHHCRFSKYGYYDADDHGCVLDIGNEENSADLTRYNLIENNVFLHGGHHVVGIYGKYNVIRKNIFPTSPGPWAPFNPTEGLFYMETAIFFFRVQRKWRRNLFEATEWVFLRPSDNNGASAWL